MSEKLKIDLKIDNDTLKGELEINSNVIVVVGENLTYKSLILDLIRHIYLAHNEVATGTSRKTIKRILEARLLGKVNFCLPSFFPSYWLCMRKPFDEGIITYENDDVLLTMQIEKRKISRYQLDRKKNEIAYHKVKHLAPVEFVLLDIKHKLQTGIQEIYRDLSWYDVIFVENVDSLLSPNNIVKFIKTLHELSKQRKKVFIETVSDLTLETLNTFITQDNGKVTVLQTERNGNNVSITCYEANKDNLIDASIYAETYLDVLREGFAYE